MKCLTILWFSLTACLLSSCVFWTSHSMATHFRYEPVSTRSSDCCYRLGDACYIPVTVRFFSSGRFVLWYHVPTLREKVLPVGDKEMCQTFYYRLSAADAAVLTGLQLPDASEEAPTCVAAEDWDSVSAVPVPLRQSILNVESVRGYRSLQLAAYTDSGVRAYVPMQPNRSYLFGFVRWPLVAVLFVGVDVPGTIISSVVLLPYLLIK